MRANALLRCGRGCVPVVAACIVLTSCLGGGDAGHPSVSSFHYVEVTTGTLNGGSLDSREEGYYRAPDSARVIGDASYSPLGLEQIVNGGRVWRRDSSGWAVDSVCYTALDKIEWILAHGGEHEGSTDDGDGPTLAGEPTHRYFWEYDDAARFLISYSELTLGDSPEAMEILARTRRSLATFQAPRNSLSGRIRGAFIR